ncbi:MAG: hypothetical protein CO092_01465 [Candidatus Aenigmarchaeota archaeon CG_4_9_14_3_um_filter_37_18]|nr:MAG: hypothetical protein COW21_00055 [Candidatus Aenigmarchaeota archaeon CG15_BIG_FIL_POST_REV_8_21_14_020_37_27]PJB75589.1 MAG: hypothetical protein CO092_01465 [Candidatus Aenigmarchaeota archaeon CG_4_9_14_3_um_filter_37_18]
MLKVKLECNNVPSYKVADCLARFSKKFPLAYKIESEGTKVAVEFRITSMSLLNELKRRLTHLKGANFEYLKIEKVLNDEESRR